MKKLLIFCLLTLLLQGCGESGPQKALNNMAKALEEHNAQNFLAQIDMGAYAQNYIRSLAGASEALNTIGVLGQMLGLGNVDELIGSIVDMKARLTSHFNQGVASGELMAQCRATTEANCPWVPQSLRDAKVTELSPEAAIARITTPQSLVSWLALRKNGNSWQVVGQAVMENDARSLAASQSGPQGGARL